jgi:hypothetical protein
VARTGNQLEAARAKAHAALLAIGADLAIASEGSFGADPENPFGGVSNLELVLLVDAKHGIEVRGHARTAETNLAHTTASSVAEALDFARSVGFPEHGVIVRRNERSRRMYKDVSSWSELEQVVKKLLSRPFVKKIFLETDMRAHCNPTRMAQIGKAMEDLRARVESACPACTMYGYGVTDVLTGLPCGMCGAETELPRATVSECAACKHCTDKRIGGAFADPGQCSFCNP